MKLSGRVFLAIAKENPARCVVIDAAKDEDAIAAEILKKVKMSSRPE